MVALLFVGVLFVLIGLAVLIGGAANALRPSGQARGPAVTGTVVAMVKRILNPGSAGVYCPVVEFTTATGQTVRFESDFGTMPASHQVGQSIPVRYLTADPRQAEVDAATTVWLVPGCMIGMGLGFLGMGSVFLVIGVILLTS